MITSPAKPSREDVTILHDEEIIPSICFGDSLEQPDTCRQMRRSKSERNEVNFRLNRVKNETFRQRSSSDPISKKAEEVASELRRRSDTFFCLYCSSRSPKMPSKFCQDKVTEEDDQVDGGRTSNVKGKRKKEIKNIIVFKPGSGTEV